jgi:hypothetical protein
MESYVTLNCDVLVPWKRSVSSAMTVFGVGAGGDMFGGWRVNEGQRLVLFEHVTDHLHYSHYNHHSDRIDLHHDSLSAYRNSTSCRYRFRTLLCYKKPT